MPLSQCTSHVPFSHCTTSHASLTMYNYSLTMYNEPCSLTMYNEPCLSHNVQRAMPLSQYHFDLSPTDFHDTLVLRYGCSVKMLANCDRCGDKFAVQHTLDCKKGGLITQHYNEVRVASGDIQRCGDGAHCTSSRG